MTFADRILIGCALALLFLNGITWYQAEGVREENAGLKRDLQTQTQAKNTAQWLLHSQEQTLQIFSTLRMANMAARRDDEKLRDEAQQQITAILAEEVCAQRIVPAPAADWLQRLEDRARTGGGNTPDH